MKKYCFLIIICLLFMPNVKADVYSMGDEYGFFGVTIGGTSNYPYSFNVDGYSNTSKLISLYNYEGVSKPYTYVVGSICSTGSPSDWYISNPAYNYYFLEDSFVSYSMEKTCNVDGYNGSLYYIQFQVGEYRDADGTGEELIASSYLNIKNSYFYTVFYRINTWYLSSDDLISELRENQLLRNQMLEIENGLVDVQEGINNVNSTLNSTNSKLDTQIQQNTEAEKTRKGIWETIKNLPSAFLDMLLGLFIPDDMDFLNDFVDALEDKLGFIASIPIQIIEFVATLVSSTWETFDSITLPSIEVFGYKFWNSQEIDLTEAINIFKPFKYVTDVICVVICARTLNRWRETFSGGGSGE